MINDNGEQFGIDFGNFLPRGVSLKNTKYIYGFVAYSGHETKIMLNSFHSKCKKSDLEQTMGRQIFYVFFIQVFEKKLLINIKKDCSLYFLFNC